MKKEDDTVLGTLPARPSLLPWGAPPRRPGAQRSALAKSPLSTLNDMMQMIVTNYYQESNT